MNDFPAPVLATEETAPFFEAARAGRLRLLACRRCGTVRAPQEHVCPECHETDHDPVDASLAAHLVTWSVVHRSPLKDVGGPYVTGYVECEEGPWLAVRILVDPATELRVGMPVTLAFAPTGPQGEGEPVPVALPDPSPKGT